MRWLALLVAIFLALPAIAQEEDDEGRLVRLIEEQLSDGAAFQVDLEGFRGALSSNARLDRLTISDQEGPWLILETAQLEWSRLALLRGAFLVDRLSAERLQLLRRPLAEDATSVDLPARQAQAFSLPDLPVRVDINDVSIERVELGEPVLGVAADLSLDGQLQLADGAGSADFEVQRLDGPRGNFDLSAGFDDVSRVLDLNLLLEEDAGGLVAELLNLPDRPDLRLSIAGNAPISDFDAQISLETGGEPRLDGFVVTKTDAENGALTFFVDIGGDISPLLTPSYRRFFGSDVALSAVVTRQPDNSLAFNTLSLRSAAMELGGTVLLAANGQPLAFDLNGRITPPDNAETIRLPARQAEVFLGGATLDLRFDASNDSLYSGQIALSDLRVDAFGIGQVSLNLAGHITESPEGISAVTGEMITLAEGVNHNDPAMARALGDTVVLSGNVDWSEATLLRLSELSMVAGDLRLDGEVTADVSRAGLDSSFDLTAAALDLRRFAGLAGLPLSGAVSAGLSGTANPFENSFDVTLEGLGADLRFVDALPATLFAGETTVALSARRDQTGLTVDPIRLDGGQVDVTGRAWLTPDAGGTDLTLRLANVGLFTNALSGPGAADLSLVQVDADQWTVAADLSGPAQTGARVTGSLFPAAGTVDVTASGSVPLALANRAISPRSVAGTVQFDLRLQGQPALSGLSGQVSTTGARLSLPTAQAAIEGLSMTGQLSNGVVGFDTSGTLTTGGGIAANGSVTISEPSFPAQVSVTGTNLRLIDPTLYNIEITRADLEYAGALAGDAGLSGTVTLGESELRVPETGLGGSSPIPPITHIGETPEQRATRAAAGLIAEATGAGGGRPLGLDLLIDAPARIFLRGRGLDAELGGDVRLGGTTANVIPAGQFDLIRGRLNILGTRLDLTEGSASLEGDLDPFINVVAVSRSNGYEVTIALTGPLSEPEITFSSSPELPEDEILAQLLFGRSIDDLSPVQLLRLADAAASLAGGSTNSGFLAGLRDNLGLDDLDLQTDEEGNAAVRAGRYLSDNIYTDVTIGQGGQADLSLNIDLTPDITARGTVSSGGDSSLGIFFERDY